MQLAIISKQTWGKNLKSRYKKTHSNGLFIVFVSAWQNHRNRYTPFITPRKMKPMEYEYWLLTNLPFCQHSSSSTGETRLFIWYMTCWLSRTFYFTYWAALNLLTWLSTAGIKADHPRRSALVDRAVGSVCRPCMNELLSKARVMGDRR